MGSPANSTITVVTPSGITILLDYDFQFGNRKQQPVNSIVSGNNRYFTDYPLMDTDNREVFVYLLTQLANTLPQEGRNKPSWTKTNGRRVASSDIYELYNVWHYHSGSWNATTKKPDFIYEYAGHTTAIDLLSNGLGMASVPCVHYMREDDLHIRIMAYSEVHQPFAKASEGDNTMVSRILSP